VNKNSDSDVTLNIHAGICQDLSQSFRGVDIGITQAQVNDVLALFLHPCQDKVHGRAQVSLKVIQALGCFHWKYPSASNGFFFINIADAA
jgi:hypothetical protein